MQTILGYKHVDATMHYARLYDSTVATDYFGAMEEVEARMGWRAQATAGQSQVASYSRW